MRTEQGKINSDLAKRKWSAEHKEYQHQWYLDNKERLKESRKENTRRWQEKVGKNYIQELQKIWRRKDRKLHPEKYRDYQLTHKYGIKDSDYQKIGESQNWKCAICFIHVSKLKVNLATDHNHLTKKVRGLLCRPCNIMLGMAREKPEILSNAIEYLKTYGNK